MRGPEAFRARYDAINGSSKLLNSFGRVLRALHRVIRTSINICHCSRVYSAPENASLRAEVIREHLGASMGAVARTRRRIMLRPDQRITNCIGLW
jgi:hypothetical protein